MGLDGGGKNITTIHISSDCGGISRGEVSRNFRAEAKYHE